MKTSTNHPLAVICVKKLQDLGKRVDFCRQTGFDQGFIIKLPGHPLLQPFFDNGASICDTG